MNLLVVDLPGRVFSSVTAPDRTGISAGRHAIHAGRRDGGNDARSGFTGRCSSPVSAMH
jgi:hypothetical protein